MPFIEEFKKKFPETWHGDTRMGYFEWRPTPLPDAGVLPIEGISDSTGLSFKSASLGFIKYNGHDLIKIQYSMSVAVFLSYLASDDGSQQDYSFFKLPTDVLLNAYAQGTSYEGDLEPHYENIVPESGMTYLLRVIAESGSRKDYPVTH